MAPGRDCRRKVHIVKTALVCIAKDEDRYMDEWILYHLKLGFSDVFVYQNDWRYAGAVSDPRAHFIQADGEAMQLPSYNEFIDENYGKFDFAAFMDVDEFLCLKKHRSVEEFLERYQDAYGVCVNWRFFGDSGLSSVQDGNYSLLGRFKKCQDRLDRHVKTILNFKKCGNMFHFVNPHFVDASVRYDVMVDVDRTCFVHGPWNYGCASETAQINHYFSKTIQEFRELKMKRGKADTAKSHPLYNYFESQHAEHNYNQVDDTTAFDFWSGGRLK